MHGKLRPLVGCTNEDSSLDSFSMVLPDDVLISSMIISYPLPDNSCLMVATLVSTLVDLQLGSHSPAAMESIALCQASKDVKLYPPSICFVLEQRYVSTCGVERVVLSLCLYSLNHPVIMSSV